MQVHIIQYKWAGSWGPFRIKIPCGECGASEGVIADVIQTDFAEEHERGDIVFEVRPWLDTWWKPLVKGGWHAPIVLINGSLVSQGVFVDRGLLSYHIRKELVKGYTPPNDRTVIYSRPGCPHCKRAKEIFTEEQIFFEDRSIIEDARAIHELFYLCKQFFPANKPITVPQIWCRGEYFGDSEALIHAQEEGRLDLFR